MQSEKIKRQRVRLITALLNMRGNKYHANIVDIYAAVKLAKFYLANGKSASCALSEGYKVLRHAKCACPN